MNDNAPAQLPLSDPAIDEMLLRLLHVGLYFHRQKKSRQGVGETCHRIFGALWQTGLYPQLFGRPVHTRGSLIRVILDNARTYKVSALISASAQKREADTPTDKTLVLFFRRTRSDPVDVDADKLLRITGYSLALSPAGMVYAVAQLASFPELTLPVFKSGADKFNQLPLDHQVV